MGIQCPFCPADSIGAAVIFDNWIAFAREKWKGRARTMSPEGLQSWIRKRIAPPLLMIGPNKRVIDCPWCKKSFLWRQAEALMVKDSFTHPPFSTGWADPGIVTGYPGERVLATIRISFSSLMPEQPESLFTQPSLYCGSGCSGFVVPDLTKTAGRHCRRTRE